MLDDKKEVYCIDANILIQAWQKYYSPDICPSYWEVLNDLGKKSIIFVPELVYDEIEKGDDNLFEWLDNSDIPIKKINQEVIKCLNDIFLSNPNNKYLVSSNKIHSKADPWVIAHAMKENAIVVTKEEKDYFRKQTKIKIPHVCDNMKVSWINDFEFIKKLKITFTCKRE